MNRLKRPISKYNQIFKFFHITPNGLGAIENLTIWPITLSNIFVELFYFQLSNKILLLVCINRVMHCCTFRTCRIFDARQRICLKPHSGFININELYRILLNIYKMTIFNGKVFLQGVLTCLLVNIIYFYIRYILIYVNIYFVLL